MVSLQYSPQPYGQGREGHRNWILLALGTIEFQHFFECLLLLRSGL